MRIVRLLGMWMGLMLVAACNSESPQVAGEPGEAANAALVAQAEPAGPPPLRVLVQRSEPDRLPRTGHPLYVEFELVEQFAQAQGRPLEFVYLDAFADLLPALAQGRGDLVAANLTLTEARKVLFDFTLPIAYSHQQLVVRADREKRPKRRRDLSGYTLGVQRGTAFYATAEALAAKVEGLTLVELPADLDSAEVLDRVAAGEVDATIEDSNLLEAELPLRDDLVAAFDVSDLTPIAWAVRKGDDVLLAELNSFLTEHHFTGRDNRPFSGDLAALRERGTLRLLTNNSSASYFLLRGELLGFEYDLVRRFAEQQKLRLEVIVVESHDQLLAKLVAGEGDIAAASLTPSAEREALGVAFSRPYHYAQEMLVARADDPIEGPDDLTDRTLVVRRSSSYWNTLEALRADGAPFKLEAAPEELETESIIVRVAEGEYDLTAADSHIVAIEMTYRDDLRTPFSLGDEQGQAWAVRGSNPELLAAINAFHDKEYRGEFYNITYRKYFRNSRNIARYKKEHLALNDQGAISPYDALIREQAKAYDFDWRLILAQTFQESRFNPKAKSWVGAKGLLQVMPRTAKELGIGELEKPENGVRAGVKYLAWVRDRFEDSLPLAERHWFSLASYNAGLGHVQDARRLARQQGWDGDVWFDNVERAMLLLSQRSYAKKARHGYVRGQEPVTYVRNIRELYLAYSRLLEQSEAEVQLSLEQRPASRRDMGG